MAIPHAYTPQTSSAPHVAAPVGAGAKLQRSVMHPNVLVLIGVCAANAALLTVAIQEENAGSLHLANAVLPLALLASLIAAAWGLIRRQPLVVWSPYFWLLTTSAAYFAFGPLIYVFGNEESMALTSYFFLATDTWVAEVNRLNAVAIGVVSAVYAVLMRVRVLRWDRVPDRDDARYTRAILAALLLIGLPIRYLVVVPFDLSLDIGTLDGLLRSLGGLVSAALVVLWHEVGSGRRRYLPLAAVLTVAELGTGIALFSKYDVLFTCMCLMLGLYSAKPKLRTLAGTGAIVIVVYMLLVPAVAEGRRELTQFDLNSNERRATIAQSVATDFGTDRRDEAQLWWTRLVYTPAQAFAMDAYRQGVPGDTFGLALYVWVPRMLWPAKPVTTLGADFNQLFAGNSDSKSAPGAFGEAYWNGGWSMVIVAAFWVGFTCAVLTRFSVAAIARRDFRWISVALTGVITGAQSDSWFVATYVGSIPIAAASGTLLYVCALLGTGGRVIRRRMAS